MRKKAIADKKLIQEKVTHIQCRLNKSKKWPRLLNRKTLPYKNWMLHSEKKLRKGPPFLASTQLKWVKIVLWRAIVRVKNITNWEDIQRQQLKNSWIREQLQWKLIRWENPSKLRTAPRNTIKRQKSSRSFITSDIVSNSPRRKNINAGLEYQSINLVRKATDMKTDELSKMAVIEGKIKEVLERLNKEREVILRENHEMAEQLRGVREVLDSVVEGQNLEWL